MTRFSSALVDAVSSWYETVLVNRVNFSGIHRRVFANMSVLSPALRARGRATYRELLRSAAVAFEGIIRSCIAFNRDSELTVSPQKRRFTRSQWLAALSSVQINCAQMALRYYLGFRLKARNDFTAGRSITNEEEYVTQLSHAHEVAQFLRKNLVQGFNETGSDTWSKYCPFVD